MILDEETVYVRNCLKATVFERKVKGVSRLLHQVWMSQHRFPKMTSSVMLALSYSLYMEAAGTSETPVNFYRAARHRSLLSPP